jgi:hypothetical protein
MINVLKNVIALMALAVCIVVGLWLVARRRDLYRKVNTDSLPIN